VSLRVATNASLFDQFGGAVEHRAATCFSLC